MERQADEGEEQEQPGQTPEVDHRSVLRASERVLDDVERALAALGDGTYGTCVTCGSRIADQDLDAGPTTQHCAEHRVRGEPA